MKLDKIEPNQKKKSKKGIIIGTSTVAVLAIASICGCTFLRSANNDVLKVAQHLVSGPVLQRALEDKKEEDDDEDWGESQTPSTIPTVSKEVAKQVETLLDRLGFGFSKIASIQNDTYVNIKDNYEFLTEKNGVDHFIYIEGIYCLSTGIDITKKPERVEEPSAPTEIQSTYGFESDGRLYVEAYFDAYSEDGLFRPRISTGKIYIDTEGLLAVEIEKVTKIERQKAEESLKERYEENLELYEKALDKYEKWLAWITPRNQWIRDAAKGKKFEVQEPDDVYDNYTNFWVCIAKKALNVSGVNISNMDEDDVNKVIEKLLAQVYTGEVLDGEFVERENVPSDLLRDILEWQYNGADELNKPDIYSEIDGLIDEFWSPDTSGEEIPGLDDDGSGGSGGGGGTTPGGDDDDDNPGGGDNPGGDDDDDDPDDPEVTIPLEVKSLAVTSPLKSGTYGIGQEIKLKVSFSKNIYASTTKENITKVNAPKLYISFVDENNSNTANKEATFESVSGGNLVYTYKITDGDNGELALGQGDNFKGTVFDEDGKMLLLTKIEEMGTTPTVVADTISPTVQAIEVISQEGSYKVGEEVEIKVTFSERVYSNNTGVPILTKTAPKLNISFGDGEIKNPQIKTIDSNGQYLIYRYIIQDDDRGNLKINPSQAFDGSQNIYDSVGNGTVLTAGVDLTGNNVTANADLAIIKLNKTELVLDLNGTKEETLSATTTPDGIEITWSVEDDKVATVDSKTGKVTAVAMGETTITATAPDGTKATCKVTVKDTTKGETKLTLNKEEIELDLSGVKEERLRASVVPSDMPLTWTSSDTKVATVDNKTGNVTAVGKGEAIITVKAQDGTKATCKVTVIDSDPKEIEPTGIEFLTINPTVILGRVPTLQMQTRLIPSNCNTNMGITFESSNEEVATVNLSGIVTIKSVGTTVITATTENGKSVSTNLNVIEINDEENILLGDVTGDGQVDSSDLISMLRHVAASASSDIRIKHQDWLVQGDSYTVIDVDGNGRVDITDVLKLQRHIAFTKSETVQQKHPDWEIK